MNCWSSCLSFPPSLHILRGQVYTTTPSLYDGGIWIQSFVDAGPMLLTTELYAQPLLFLFFLRTLNKLRLYVYDRPSPFVPGESERGALAKS